MKILIDLAKCAIESVKTAADVYAPVAGKVLSVNSKLTDEPQGISAGAETDGWLVKIKVTDSSNIKNMMDANAYKEFLKSQEH